MENSGVFTSRELRSKGHSGRSIRAAVDVGNLVAHRPGWYSSPGADSETVSAIRAGGVLTCCSAFAFYKRQGIGLWIPPGRDLHVRLSRAAKVKPVSRAGWVKICQGYGRPIPALTAVDSIPHALNCAARCVNNDYWIAMCDSVLHNTSWTIPDLQAHMGTVPGKLIALMRRCDAAAESGTESLVRVRLESAGYRVHVQPRISRGRKRGDLRIGRLLLEIDSEGSRSGEARRQDIRRDRKTLGKGWLTMRIDYREVLESWDEVLADIAELTMAGKHRIGTRDYPLPIE